MVNYKIIINISPYACYTTVGYKNINFLLMGLLDYTRWKNSIDFIEYCNAIDNGMFRYVRAASFIENKSMFKIFNKLNFEVSVGNKKFFIHTKLNELYIDYCTSYFVNNDNNKILSVKLNAVIHEIIRIYVLLGWSMQAIIELFSVYFLKQNGYGKHIINLQTIKSLILRNRRSFSDSYLRSI